MKKPKHKPEPVKKSCIICGSEFTTHRPGRAISCGTIVHMLMSIPPKYSVAQVVGYLKGKSAIYIARTFMGKPRNFTGESFWARGYFVSTVGRDEKAIREYIQKQE